MVKRNEKKSIISLRKEKKINKQSVIGRQRGNTLKGKYNTVGGKKYHKIKGDNK